MRYAWTAFLLAAVALLGLIGWSRLRPAPAPTVGARAGLLAVAPPLPVQPATLRRATTAPASLADSLVAFAVRQIGAPYTYAGTSPVTGFDCSGFVLYVFGHFRVPVPHSTAALIHVGRAVPRREARPGDIVVFTGTADTSTTPGHAGIVISGPGEPIRFVHSSSARRESGVKISEVESTGYERRFMGVRRVL